MREVDVEQLQELLVRARAICELTRVAAHHEVAEALRPKRLIADEPAAWTELAAQIDPTGLQQIRSLARQARAEQAGAHPPAAARQLFRRLREAFEKPAI